MTAVFLLDPHGYQPHEIHVGDRQWAETNCYVDVLIELLHAWGFEPIAAFPFTSTIDFEGDQWTFFKFPPAHLDRLFSLDVQELQIWRSLEAHLEEQVKLGRPVLVELDSFFLPDTAGTSYRQEHVKSTVAVIEIDISQKLLGYFHGRGYYHLSGEDFDGILYRAGKPHPSMLPPYVEIVKRRAALAPTGEFLMQASLNLLTEQLQKLPNENPFEKFRTRFESDLKWLVDQPIEVFHQYSFATLRQFGACYELTATYLRWLNARGVTGMDQSIDAFDSLSIGAKTLQFQLARALARRRPLDLAAIDRMAELWRTATEDLKLRFVNGK